MFYCFIAALYGRWSSTAILNVWRHTCVFSITFWTGKFHSVRYCKTWDCSSLSLVGIVDSNPRFECCVLSGGLLCDELITRPEESYPGGVSECDPGYPYWRPSSNMAVEPWKKLMKTEGEYRLSYTLSLTLALDGVRWSIPHPHTPTDLISRKTRYSFYRRLGWPHGTCGHSKILSQLGFDPWTVRP